MTLQQTILLLADRRHSRAATAIRGAGYRLIMAFTPDHAVAICVENDVHAVVLDQDHFVVTEDWSVAQSLKMVKPRICVALIVRGELERQEMPVGVDATIPEGDTVALLETLSRLV